MSAAVHRGTVNHFNSEKGFGFITSELGDVYLRKIHLRYANQASKLQEGCAVQFTVVTGQHRVTGAEQLEARNVQIVAQSSEATSKVDNPPAASVNGSLQDVVADSNGPLRKHGLWLARDLIRQNGDVFNKKLVKALARGLGAINSEEQYGKARLLLAGNLKDDGLQWARLNKVLFDQADNIYKVRLWLDGLVPTCDSVLVENAYLKGDAALQASLLARSTPEQHQQLISLPVFNQAEESVSKGSTEVLFSGIRAVILAELMKAEKRISVAVAWFTNHHLFEALCQRVRDGLEVELIILNDPINNWTEGLRFQEFIELGRERGNSRLYFSNIGERPMHHKFCLIDDKLVLNGSYNWTYYAESVNFENCMVFREQDAILAQFKQEFNSLTEKLERVELVVPSEMAVSSSLDIHRAAAYRSNDVLAHAREIRRSNSGRATILVRQALLLNPDNEEAKRMQPRPGRLEEHGLREQGIDNSIKEIETAQQLLRDQGEAETVQANQREQESKARAEEQAREQREQARKREAERQAQEAEQGRLREERIALEAQKRRDAQEVRRLQEIAEKELELAAQREKLEKEKRESELLAKQLKQVQEREQRAAQKRADAAAEARAKKERELAEKVATLEATKGVALQGKRGELRINLAWKSFDDLDLHVYDPDGNQIFFGTTEAVCQGSTGKLDVDSNAGEPRTRTPQENIFWSQNPPKGKYRVEVNNYNILEKEECPFVLTIIPEVGAPRVLAGKTIGANNPVQAIEFNYSSTVGLRAIKSI